MLFSIFYCFFSFIILFAPGFFVCLIKNGLGDVQYPICYWYGNQIIVQTAAHSIGLITIALLVLSFCLGSIAYLALHYKRIELCVGYIILFLLPYLPNYDSLSTSLPFLFKYLPSTYLSFARLSGFPDTFGQYNIVPFEGMTPFWGVMILLVYIVGISMLGCVINRVAQNKRYKSARDHSKIQSLVVDDVSVSYTKNVVLQHVQLKLYPGEIQGLIAPNGCGKSTLLDALSGSTSLHTVRASIALGLKEEESPISPADYRYKKYLVYVPSEGQLLYPHLTVEENLKLVGVLWGTVAQMEHTISVFGIGSYREKQVRTLSQGMKQQASLAAAFMTSAQFLLLDEPMNALDPSVVRMDEHILKQFVQRGGSIVLSSHLLVNLERICTRVLYIKNREVQTVELDSKAMNLEQLDFDIYA